MSVQSAIHAHGPAATNSVSIYSNKLPEIYLHFHLKYYTNVAHHKCFRTHQEYEIGDF